MSHLYEALLGPGWRALAPVTRRLHSPDPVVLFEGEVDIDRGRNPLAGLVALGLGLPRAGRALPALVRVRQADGGEWLERWYDGRRFATFQARRAGRLIERFGAFELGFQLHADADGLRFEQTGVRLWGMSLPGWLWPRVRAQEGAAGNAHLFDVTLTLPGIGMVVAYRGRLEESVD